MSEQITQALDAMQARCDAATDGPWEREWDTSDQWWTIHGQPNPAKGDDRMVCPEVATLNHREDWTADAAFIAAARTDMPRLIAALRALHEKLGIDDYCEACTHGDCETSRTIAEALGVGS